MFLHSFNLVFCKQKHVECYHCTNLWRLASHRVDETIWALLLKIEAVTFEIFSNWCENAVFCTGQIESRETRKMHFQVYDAKASRRSLTKALFRTRSCRKCPFIPSTFSWTISIITTQPSNFSNMIYNNQKHFYIFPLSLYRQPEQTVFYLEINPFANHRLLLLCSISKCKFKKSFTFLNYLGSSNPWQ